MVKDGLVFGGAGLIATGLWWIWPPLALLYGGCALCGIGFLLHRHGK
jgi:hypothetical protein